MANNDLKDKSRMNKKSLNSKIGTFCLIISIILSLESVSCLKIKEQSDQFMQNEL